MQSLLKRLSDNKNKNSLANRLRRKRFRHFLQLLEGLEKPVKVLDVGGTALFWEQMGLGGQESPTASNDQKQPGNKKIHKLHPEPVAVKIYLLNKTKEAVTHRHFISLAGDARDLKQFEDSSFDIAFSNSVIEHVGGWDEQQRMAREMLRVGKRIILQTPNRFFPIEPHFLFPFFQFLPVGWRIFLVRHFNMGWYRRTPDRHLAEKICRSIRLLTRNELQKLFPGSEIRTERFLGMAKSYIVMH